MHTKAELIAHLEQEKLRVNAEFPNYVEITAELFRQIYSFFDVDFPELTDNRIYRYFLGSFKEMICFAFESDVSKAYLRCVFKGLNNEIVVGYLGNYAKSRAKDIQLTMDRFLGFFIATWQGYNDDKKRVLDEIIRFIEYQM